MATVSRVVRRVRDALPLRARLFLHQKYDAVSQLFEGLLGNADPLVPPARLMFVGGDRKDFRALGDKWVQTFIRLAGLKPGESVLDVGCGVGRMAVALTQYLTPQGRYEGFDIVLAGIEWCQREITSRFPHFRFEHANVYNKEYNPGGELRASEYSFPYENEAFEFVLLTSVFTHMLPADVTWYLTEIRRVLRPRGRCLVTFFVLDAEARKRIDEGNVDAVRRFAHDLGGYWVVDRQAPEAALAYTEEAVREMFRGAGLTLQEPIHYGTWAGRGRARSNHSQDIVVARVQ